ncbi:hypothetical protein Fot_30435 [Forsythia ovata]|uniref:ATP synthase F0 subunit 8 n=1 Tax=Forsythia ovata TaxID=205694 RepID=A0ABD1TUR3_9LAMI
MKLRLQSLFLSPEWLLTIFSCFFLNFILLLPEKGKVCLSRVVGVVTDTLERSKNNQIITSANKFDQILVISSRFLHLEPLGTLLNCLIFSSPFLLRMGPLRER